MSTDSVAGGEVGFVVGTVVGATVGLVAGSVVGFVVGMTVGAGVAAGEVVAVGVCAGFVVGALTGNVVGFVVAAEVGPVVAFVADVPGTIEGAIVSAVALVAGWFDGFVVGVVVGLAPGFTMLTVGLGVRLPEGSVVNPVADGFSAFVGAVVALASGFVCTVGLFAAVPVGVDASSVGDAAVLLVDRVSAVVSEGNRIVSPVGAWEGLAPGFVSGAAVTIEGREVSAGSWISGLFLSGSSHMNPIISRIPTTAKSHRRSFFSGGMISFSAKGFMQ